MARKLIWLTFPAVLTILLLGISTLAIAETVTVFEKSFEKTKGKPVEYVESFQVPPGCTSLKMYVNNGPGKKGQVKNYSISINDVDVVTDKGFNKASASEKPIVNYQSANKLKITMKGQGGNAILVSITGEVEEVEAPAPPLPGLPDGF